jgi:glycerol uptake facilitator-like aquaporin
VGKVACEALGTALLLAVIVGSGVVGEHLTDGNESRALLCSILITGVALMLLMVGIGPISGAHFNPAVTLAFAARREIQWQRAVPYLSAQIVGALAGVAAANWFSQREAVYLSERVRSGGVQVFSEFITTFGLLSLVFVCSRYRAKALPYVVVAYVTLACWLSPSTAFVNPAATLARAATNTLTGIRLADVPGFVAAQLAGAAAAVVLFRRRAGRAPS